MKKVFKTMAFTLLGLVLSMNLMADEATITFANQTSGTSDGSSAYTTSNFVSSGIASSDDAFGTITCSATEKCYSGKTGYGLKAGAKSSAGSFTISFSSALKNVTKIVLNRASYSDSKTATITVKNGETTLANAVSTQSGSANFSNMEIKDLNITSLAGLTVSTSKYCYIKSITITYTADDPSGPTLESIYFTNDAATKLSYTEGDVFDPAGLVVMGRYSEGDDKDVTDDVEWSFSPETLAKTTTSVTVTASIDGVDDAQKVVNGLTVAAAPKYTKVTANKTDWSGEYLLVYEGTGNNAGTAYVWTGVDAADCNATATISNNQITKHADAVSLTIAAMDGGYSILVNGGTNDGKYIYGTSSKNQINFGTTASANTITYPYADDNNSVKIVSNSATMRYNNASNNNRFRYFGSAGQQNVQLYEKVLDPISSAVTFAAPADGSLVIKNGATPIATGATIQDGTVLDVTFDMTPAEAYKDVAIKVTNTTTSADVTSTVYNSETQKITMPRYAITVAVTFTKLYKIEAASITGGTISWEDEDKNENPTYVEAGKLITATAEPDAKHENPVLDIYKTGASTEKVSHEGGYFEMPTYDVTISASFSEKQCTQLATPTNVQVTDKTYSGAKLTWNVVANADYYEVYIKKGGVDVENNIVETEEYTISSTLEAITEYTYSIVAGSYDEDTYCASNPVEGTFTTADYPAVVLTLSENENTTPVNGKLNTPIELPTTSTQACDGKVFVGWSENPIEGEVGKDQVTLLGETYTFTDPSVLAKTIYAVYAKAVPSGTQKYTLDYATDVSSKTLGYGSAVEVTASDGSKWIVKASKQQGMQINTGKNASIKIPTCPRNITSIEVVGTAEKAVGLSAEDYSGSGTITYIAFGTDAKEQTIDLTNKSVTSGYIVGKSGANPITKIVVNYEGESTYSNYCTTCQAAVAAPTFSLDEGEYDEAKTLTLSATEGDIYYTINDGEETKYTAAIALNNRGTYEISAYAKVDERTSETVTKTYTLDWAYTLTELVAEGAPTSTGRTVTVVLDNEVIDHIATSGSYTNGFYTMVGTQMVEVYCYNSPSGWEAGGKVSGTVTCPWKEYKGTWELCPENWTWASYTAPAKITSLVITGDVDNKNYTAGQKLDFTGLTVTGVYSDATEENVTADVVWTEVTLTENQVEAIAKATLNNAKTGNLPVVQSKTITGLTVGAAKTLESIYVDNEHSTHKTAFFVGRPFSAEGLKVMARYNMGDDQQIALANLTIDNPTFSAAEAEHTINIFYTENEVEKSTSYKVSVGYMNLSDLVAEDIPTNTSVKVAFSNVEITGFYKNSSDKRAGVYVNVIGKNGSNIELYSSGTPSATLNDWQEGGKLASKGNYISGTWKYYDGNDVWEIDFGSAYAWATNIEYTAPEIYPTEISMSIPTATVKQSKSLDLEANFNPANATVLNNLEWSSDNNQVTVVPSQDKKSAKVTVAPDATVGTATITVKVDDKDGNKLSATCVITIQEYSVPRYGLYNGAISGGDYIFKADGEYYFMNNTISSSRLTNVANADDPEIINNVITTEVETYVWHIAKSGDYWTIQNLANSKYAAGTGTKNQAQLLDACTDDMAKWTITYDEAKDVYTFENLGRSKATSYSDNKYLRNNDNSGWACYANGTGNAITLYKAGFTPAAALTSIEIDATSDVLTKEYIQGATFSTIGLKVLGNYSDLTQSEITSGITWTVEPSVLNETGDNISVTVTAHAKGFDSESRVITGIKVSEPAQEHVYGFFNFMDNGPDITDWEETSAWSTTYTTPHNVVADEATVHFEGAAKQTSTIINMPVVKQAAIVLELTEEDKQITSVILATAKWGSKSKKITAAVSLDGENYTDLEVEGNETDGLSTAITQNGVRYVKFIPESNDNQLGIATLTFTTADIQYDYERTDLVVGNYGTMCVPYAVKATDRSGATFWSIETSNTPGYTNPSSVTIVEETGDLVAGKPYIFCATETEMTMFFSGDKYEESESVPANGLYGNLTDETITINDQNDPNAGPEPTRGFFFVLQQKLYECGWNCTVGPNRGWVQAAAIENMTTPSPAPRRVIGNPNGTPTGIHNLNADGFKNIEGARKYFHNNNIVIVNEGRIYNAQGILIQ